MSPNRKNTSNRRHSARHETRVPVIVGTQDHSHEFAPTSRFEGRIEQLSLGGMRARIAPVSRIEYRASLRKGAFFSAKGRLPGCRDEAELYGAVVWSEFSGEEEAGECLAGVCFQRLAGPSQKALEAAMDHLAAQAEARPAPVADIAADGD